MNSKDKKQLNTLLSPQYQNELSLKVIAEVIQYFRSLESAKSWLTNENRGLGNVTPISLMIDDTGVERVHTSLSKLAHGMTA